MAHCEFTLGRLLCGKLRSFLDECKFKGMDIEYIESKGWIERKFVVKGNDADIKNIHECVCEWGNRMNMDDS